MHVPCLDIYIFSPTFATILQSHVHIINCVELYLYMDSQIACTPVHMMYAWLKYYSIKC